MKRNQGFTLIELLAVIIILAVIALIATPIVLSVVDKAKGNARQSSVAGYADAAKLYVYDEQFKSNGQVPSNEEIKKNTTNQGDTVVCEEVLYSSSYGIVLHACNVGDDTNKYYFASGKTYTEANDATYKVIYDSIKGGSVISSIVSNISNDCAKGGNTCTIEQIKTGVSMNVQVSPTETHKFYVLSDDGNNVTLLMDRNLDLDKNGTPNDKLAWQSSGNNADGPITALTALENYTNAWTNITSLNYNLTGTSANDYNGCYPYNICTTNTYTIPERTNVKARLPRNQELAAIGCNNSCQAWAYDYLNDGPNPIAGIYGYWTSTAYAIGFNFSWSVFNNDVINGNSYGVRPVITISKSNIK